MLQIHKGPVLSDWSAGMVLEKIFGGNAPQIEARKTPRRVASAGGAKGNRVRGEDTPSLLGRSLRRGCAPP